MRRVYADSNCIARGGRGTARRSARLRTNAFSEMGRADGPRFRPGDREIAGDLRSAVWDHRKARPATTSRNRLDQRALGRRARRGARVRSGLSGLLLRPDIRGTPRARYNRLQRSFAIRAVAGNHRRDGAERLQKDRDREWAWRQQSPVAVFRAISDGGSA